MGLAAKFIEGSPLPESLGERADLYKEVEELRLAMQKKVDAVKKRETEIKNSIIEDLPKGDTGAAGQRYRVQVTTKPAASVNDRDAFNAFVRENNRFDLLSKSVSQRAIKDMWEGGEDVPGVERVNTPGLSFRKL